MTTPYDKEIAELELHLEADRKSLSALNKRKAAYLCPYEVGQRLVDKRGKKSEIVSITMSYSKYSLTGRDVLKDGNLGRRTHRLYDWDGWKPLT